MSFVKIDELDNALNCYSKDASDYWYDDYCDIINQYMQSFTDIEWNVLFDLSKDRSNEWNIRLCDTFDNEILLNPLAIKLIIDMILFRENNVSAAAIDVLLESDQDVLKKIPDETILELLIRIEEIRSTVKISRYACENLVTKLEKLI